MRGFIVPGVKRLKRTLVSIAVLSLVAAVAQAQTAAVQERAPDFRVQVWSDVVTDFGMRVSTYVDLRRELEKGLPPLTVTDNPAEIRRAVRALAKRVRSARAHARSGEFFTPTISLEFRRALRREVNVDTCTAILHDHDKPGESLMRINSRYPQKKPHATVPLSVLAVLPELPDDIEYRFLGRHVILLDTRAGVVLDHIPYAIACGDDER